MMRSPSAPEERLAEAGTQEMRAAAASALHDSSASSSRPVGGAAGVASDGRGSVESEQATITVADRSSALTRFRMKAPRMRVEGEGGPGDGPTRSLGEDRTAVDRITHDDRLQREVLEPR